MALTPAVGPRDPRQHRRAHGPRRRPDGGRHVTHSSSAEIAAARAAVVEAGRIAMRHFRQPHESWEKGPGQLVTEADLAVDRFLKDALCAAPATAGCRRRPRTTVRVWPAAGSGWSTRSTAPAPSPRASPSSRSAWPWSRTACRSLGFVYNPGHRGTVRGGARRGRHAQRRADARQRGRRSRRCPHRGQPVREPPAEFRFADARRPRLSSLGSLAYKLALVAAGRYDGYLSWRRTHDWDIAAAVLLLEEAGARIADAGGGAIQLNQPEPVHSGHSRGRCGTLSGAACAPRPVPMPPTGPIGGRADCRTEAAGPLHPRRMLW